MVMVKNSDYVGETKLRTDIHSDQNSKDKASTLNHLKHLQSTVTTNQCPISLFGYAVKSKGLSDVEVIERLNKLPYISFFFLICRNNTQGQYSSRATKSEGTFCI